jgi:predicted Zn-dependent protease
MTLFDDSSVELGSKLIVMGTYSAELNQNKVKNIPDPDKEAFALSLLEKLQKSNPSDVSVHVLGGDLYLSTGKNREAQSEYARPLKREKSTMRFGKTSSISKFS